MPESRVIQAGAGAGKTHRLVTLALQLFAEGLEPARLCAVTFTEKAAAELQGRIRLRVDALCAGGAELEVPARVPAFWRAVRRDLSLAQTGTLHSLCAQILRRHAVAAGLDPRFSVLDELQAGRILFDACETAVLRALERSDAGAVRLCAELGLRSQHQFGSGVTDELLALLRALGESGQDPVALVEGCAGLSREAVLAEDAAARERFLSCVAALPRVGRTETERALLAALRELPALDHPPGALDFERHRAWWTALPQRRDAVKGVAQSFEEVLDADAAVRGAQLARDLAALAAEARGLQREAKQRAHALDFDDLTRLAKDLLARDERLRAAEQARIGALLVDEFQDTSRAQLELLRLLAPGGALTVVGDRKQSIYEFRGADVSGAQQFAEALVAAGAEREVLKASRRSRPALVDYCNLLFQRALAPSARPFDTPFTSDDALTAVRTEPGSCVELIDVSGPGVEAEAEAVARRLSALLAQGVRGGDIAILLRKMTNLEAFRRALLRRRIPHLVYKGRGFLEAREVLDAISLMEAALDPDDGLALAAVLRSPFGPLSDDALVLLSAEGRLGRKTLLDALGDARARGDADPALAEDDALALARTAQLVLVLSREVDRLGPAAFLEAALAEADYVAACAGGLYGEQAAANLERLAGLARKAELRGESVRQFAAALRALLEDEAREPEAPVVEETDPHAVRILTVHAAKGLEFPVVIVPECASPSAIATAERCPLDAELGFAFKASGADGERRFGAHGAALRARKQERELSQSRRLFYVAATRARDLLVLSSRAARKAECWRTFIDAAMPEALARGLVQVVPDGGDDVPALPLDRAPADPSSFLAPQPGDAAPGDGIAARTAGTARGEDDRSTRDAEVKRVAAAPTGACGTVIASVTQLADAAACPRRYHLLHELQLDERPVGEAGAGRAATDMGTLAHRLLERIPLETPRSERRALLLRLAREESGEDAEAVVDAVCAFLDSPLGARLAAAPAARRMRELPFSLRLEGAGAPELLLRGQIDALLLDGDATVIDYKLSRARGGTDRYRTQLEAYALAADALMQGRLPVRSGLVFLRSPGAPFVERPAPDAAELAQIRKRLLAAAGSIAGGRATSAWSGRERGECERLDCGFIPRCHPTAEEVT